MSFIAFLFKKTDLKTGTNKRVPRNERQKVLDLLEQKLVSNQILLSDYEWVKRELLKRRIFAGGIRAQKEAMASALHLLNRGGRGKVIPFSPRQ